MSNTEAQPIKSGLGSKPRGKTRLMLLDAGLSLFSKRGLEGVTVSELEEAVGLKPGNGSFYRHFADKDALLEAIIEREIASAQFRRQQEQDALYKPEQDVRSALRQQFQLTLKGLRENEDLINLLNRASEHFPSLIDRLRVAFAQDAISAVAKSYAERIKRGELLDADPMVIASVVQSSLFGYVKTESALGKPLYGDSQETDFIETLITMLVR